MKKLLIVFGTRPEAIKLAPVVYALHAHPDLFDARICLTAQHREMLDQVISWFDLPVHYDLDLMRHDQSLFDVTASVLTGVGDVIRRESPDLLLVQGDTTTTFAASLAAFYRRLPVAHVEAGLRTYQKDHPFPEEINRRLTSTLADLHFAPTERARRALLAESVSSEAIFVTGNTVVDALLMTLKKLQTSHSDLPISPDRRLLLVTGHRRENFGEGLVRVCRALRILTERYAGDIEIVYPVHPNPNVRTPVNDLLGGIPSIHLIPPLDYPTFVFLLNRSYVVITDSGGIQEEAPSLGKPVLVTRETTERPEAVEAGTVRLVGTDIDRIVIEASRLLDDPDAYRSMAFAHNPYGDGHAAERIINILKNHFL
jgi:UDP-N-acetylglucosamine 2-epimerase (non-hydrolysing)